MNFEIRTTQNNLVNGEVKSVRIGYQAKSKSKSLNASGTFELSPEEFKGKSVDQLIELSKEHFEKEISAE